MSTTAPFKLPCPNCGGVLTIKNAGLIGKKIDCPKCKTRMLVQEPGGKRESAENETKPDKAKPSKTKPDTDKPATEGTPPGESGDKKKKKKKKGPKPMYVLAGVGVLVLVIVGVVIMMTGEPTPPAAPTFARGAGPKPVVTQPTSPVTTKPPVDTFEADVGRWIRELNDAKLGPTARQALLAKIQAVATPEDQDKSRTVIRRLLEEAKKRKGGRPFEVLEEARKAVKDAELQKEIVKAIDDFKRDRAMEETAWRDYPSNQIPNDADVILHVRVSELDKSSLREALFAEGAFRSQDFEQSLGIPLNNIEQLLVTANSEHGQCVVIVRTHNPFDWARVKSALRVGEETKSAGGTDYYLGSVSFLNEFLEARFPVAGLRSAAGIVRRNDKTLVYGTPAAVHKFLESPPQPNPKWLKSGTPTEGNPLAVQYRTYLTISEEYRALIEQVEKETPRPLLLYAETAPPGNQKLLPLLSGLHKSASPLLDTLARDLLRVDGLALAFDAEAAQPITLRAVLSCGSIEGSEFMKKTLEILVAALGKKELRDYLGTPVVVKGHEPVPEPMKPDMGPEAMMPDPTKPEPKKPKEPTLVEFSRMDKYVTMLAEFKEASEELIDQRLAPEFVFLRGQMDMQSRPFRVRELGDAVPVMLSGRKGSFPYGAFPRPPVEGSNMRDSYLGHQRVSWMVELLPYLGDDRYGRLHSMVDTSKSWDDPHNLRVAQILVPHFLDPQSPPYYSQRMIGDVQRRLANTHFVGMSGVGPDSMFYPKAHPLAGIFGDPVARGSATTVKDVSDGLSSTILMIQNDPSLYGPWLQGGGSTMRGTSRGGDDVGMIGGFRSTPLSGGREGVWVLMADGSVRFLRKGMSPDVFRALSTMAGADNDKIGDLEKVAPRRQPDGTVPPHQDVQIKPVKPEVKPEKPVSTIPEWKPRDGLLAKLAPEYDVGGYLIRYPSGYGRSVKEEGGDRFASFIDTRMPTRSRAELHLTIFKRSENDLKLTQAEAFQLGLRRLNETTEQTWESGAVETGSIDGKVFMRTSLVRKRGGEVVERGRYYLSTEGAVGIAFFMCDILPGDEVSIDLMEAAVMTLRKK